MTGFYPDIIYGIPNQIVQFNLTARNSGNTISENTVMYYMPIDSLKPIRYYATKGTFVMSDAAWYIGTMQPSEEVEIIIDFAVINANGDITMPYIIESSQNEANFENNYEESTLTYKPIRDYKCLLINVMKAGDDLPIQHRYTLENTIGEYIIGSETSGVYTITFPNYPDGDGSEKMYVSVDNIDAYNSPATLRVWEYYGNKAYFTIQSTTNESEQLQFYEAFIEVRFYN